MWLNSVLLLSFYSFGRVILYAIVKFFTTINQMGRGLVMRCMYGLMEAQLQIEWTEGWFFFFPPGGMGFLFYKLTFALPGGFAVQLSLKASLGFGMEVGEGLACPLYP